MKGPSFHTYKEFLFLFLFAILAYWPVSFMAFSAKGDAINYFLAMRYNTSEALQHGYFPYWTPYINMGYPIHGDIQSGVWNPLVFLMSLLRQYDVYWLHTEMILIIFIAGAGMFKLLRYFRFEKKTCLLIACAYMLNGYITDGGQFLNWLYAAAFLPWVFLYLLKCFTSFRVKDAFKLGIAHSLMFLCAYPADTILLSYIIVAFVIISFIREIRRDSWAVSLRKHLTVSFIASITIILTCLPAILSFMDFIPQINRGNGVPIEDAMVNSLAPANLVSVLMPWPTMRGAAFAATDPLIRNCYMGILALIFLIYYFLRRQKKDGVQKFLVGMFVVFLLFSFGPLGGLRYLSYYVLPLMDSFRHPANAKLFFLFAAQVLAAFAINQYILQDSFKKSHLKKITLGLLIIAGLAFIFSLFGNHIVPAISSLARGGGSSFGDLLKTIRDQLSFHDLLFLNSLFVLIILAISYWLIKKEKLQRYFLPLMCLELFITAQLMLPLTYVRKSSVTEVQSILDRQPKGYPLPDMHASLSTLAKDGELYFEKIGCLNPYNKKPSRTEYIITPSNLATQDAFWENVPLREKLMSYPLAYFADTIFHINDTLSFLTADTSMKAAITEGRFQPPVSRPDSASIVVTRFHPNGFDFEVYTGQPAFFVLMQNYYGYWRVTVNDQEGYLGKTNLSFMGVAVPAGKSTIRFTYKKTWLNNSAIFSVIFVLGGIIFFSINNKKRTNR